MKNLLHRDPARFFGEMAALVVEHRVFSYAGSLAYFLILSVFPTLICLNALMGLMGVDLPALLSPAEGVLPQGGLELLEDYARYLSENQSPGLFWAGLAGMLLSASAAFRQLLSVMDRLYGHPSRGISRVVESVVFSLLMLITIYLSLLVLLTGSWFFRWLGSAFRLASLPWDWMWIRFLLLFSFLLLFLLVLYRLAAFPRRRREDQVTPPLFSGALLAAAALVVASGVFSWLVSRSSRYSLVYGSLASVIALLVWLYLCGCVVLLGGVFNRVLLERKIDRKKRG